MAKIELHHLFIIRYLSIICALCSTLLASPPPLAGIKFKLDTDVDSLCHPSVAPSPFLSFSFSLSLSPHRSEDTSARRRISLQSSPPLLLPLSLYLTLSNSLHLSPTLPFTHTQYCQQSFRTRDVVGIKVHRGGE